MSNTKNRVEAVYAIDVEVKNLNKLVADFSKLEKLNVNVKDLAGVIGSLEAITSHIKIITDNYTSGELNKLVTDVEKAIGRLKNIKVRAALSGRAPAPSKRSWRDFMNVPRGYVLNEEGTDLISMWDSENVMHQLRLQHPTGSKSAKRKIRAKYDQKLWEHENRYLNYMRGFDKLKANAQAKATQEYQEAVAAYTADVERKLSIINNIIENATERIGVIRQKLESDVVRLAMNKFTDDDYEKHGKDLNAFYNNQQRAIAREELERQREREREYAQWKKLEYKRITEGARSDYAAKAYNQADVRAAADKYSAEQIKEQIRQTGILVEQKERELRVDKDKIMLLEKESEFATHMQEHRDKVVAIQLGKQEINILKEALKIREQREKQDARLVAKREADAAKEEARLQKQAELNRYINDIYERMSKILGSVNAENAALTVEKLNAEIALLPKNLRRAAVEEYSTKLQEAGVRTEQVGTKLKFMNTSLVESGSAFKRMTTQLRESFKEMFSIEKLAQRISFVITATFSYRAFQFIKDTLKNITKSFIEFQDEMSKVFTLIADASDQTKRKLTQDVRDIARTYRLELAEVSDALYQILSAQIAVEDSTRVLDAAVRLSVGGFASAADSALALVQILNAFELDASRAAHVADVAFETVRLGIITTQQYADQISKVGSTAAMFGISIEEVSAAISVMTRNGVKVDQAFTSLNQLLMTIANPTEEARRTMEAYGVTLDMNTVRSKGLVAALTDLGGILKSEEAMTNIVKSRTGAKAMFTLIQNSQDYVDDLIQMYSSAGAAADAANVRLQTAASVVKDLGANVRDVGLSIGAEMEPAIRRVMQTLSSTFKFFAKNAEFVIAFINTIVINLSLKILPIIVKSIPEAIKLILSGLKWLTMSSLQHKKATDARSVSTKKLKLDTDNLRRSVDRLVVSYKGELYQLNRVDAARRKHIATIEGETAARLKQMVAAQQANAATSASATVSLAAGAKGATAAGASGALAGAGAALGKAGLVLAIIQTIVYLLAQVYNWFSAIRNRVRRANIEAEFGLKNVEGRLKSINGQLENLDKQMAAVEGLYKMMYQLDEQYKNLGDDPRKAEEYNHRLERTVELYNHIMDAEVKAAEVRGNFMRYSIKVQEKYNIIQKETLELTIEQTKWMLRQQAAGIVTDWTSDKPGSGYSRLLVGGRGNAIKIGQKVTEDLRDLVSSILDLSIDSDASEIKDAKDKIKKFADTYEFEKIPGKKGLTSNTSLYLSTYYSTYDEVKNLVNNTIDTIYQLRGFLLGIEKSKFDELVQLTIPSPSEYFGGGKGDAGKELRERFEDVVQKYIDLYAKFGLQFSTKASRELEKLEREIEKIAAEKTTKDSTKIEELKKTLTDFSAYALLFGEINETLKEKTFDFADIKNKLATVTKKLSLVNQSDIDALADVLRSTGSNALAAIADSLTAVVKDTVEQLTDQRDDIVTQDTMRLIRRSKVEAEKEKLAMQALELNTELYKQVGESTYYEMKKLLDDNKDITEVERIAIGYQMDRQKKVLGEILRSFAGKYSSLLKDVENNLDSLSALFDYISTQMSKVGLKPHKLTETISALLAGVDVDTIKASLADSSRAPFVGTPDMSQVTTTLFPDVTKPDEAEYWAIESSYARMRYLQHLYDIYNGEINDELAEFYRNIEEEYKRRIAETEKDKPTLEKIAVELKGVNIDDPKYREFMRKSNQYQELRNEYSQALASDWSGIITSEQAFMDIVKQLIELHGYDEETIKAMTPAQLRKTVYDITKERPEDMPLSYFEKPGAAKGTDLDKKKQLADGLKSLLGVDEELTLADAFEFVKSGVLDTVSQGWQLFWDKQLEIHNKAREAALKVEEDYVKRMQEQADIMTANENTSAAEREAIQQRLAEAQRLAEERKQETQEKFDKKAAELRRKQAIAELNIDFAKSVAMIWARQLSTEGAAGLISAGVLTGILTSLHAAQMAIIMNQKFAEGGYTGTGVGKPDSTGHRPAGIVHEGEFVFTKDMVDRNFNEIAHLFNVFKKGGNVADYFASLAVLPRRNVINRSGSFAAGGYAATVAANSAPLVVDINLGGVRVIDDIELHQRVTVGGSRRRWIRG